MYPESACVRIRCRHYSGHREACPGRPNPSVGLTRTLGSANKRSGASTPRVQQHAVALSSRHLP
jgi:hypothetical protein